VVFDADGVDGGCDDGSVEEGEKEADADAVRWDGLVEGDGEGWSGLT
jgi:hypothetical protein